MTDPFVVAFVAGSLLLAGVLELASVPVKGLFYPKLMALGLFMLSARLWFLLWTGDLGRLNVWGLGPISMIAVSRIYYCVQVMRRRL